MKVLFVSSEAQPLVKTGGLADVAGALPAALKASRHDVRVLLPAYRGVLDKVERARTASTLTVAAEDGPVRLLETRLTPSGVPAYLVDAPGRYDRPGNPYTTPEGFDWPDNPERFALLGRAAVLVALDEAGLGWRPDVVHCNDWQSGLAPALLSREAERPRTVFTIHNLAYQGVFGWETFRRLELPMEMWATDGLEFYGGFSFIKGGIAYADAVTTVSPTYAREICNPALGYRLDGLLRSRADHLFGILNGVDYQQWDPQHDLHIPANFTAERPAGKARNKAQLQREMGLDERPEVPLLVHVGRLVEQKGIDLILGAIVQLLPAQDFQLAVLGSGEAALEQALDEAAAHHPRQVAVRIGYDEGLAHRLEAGGDMFVMPSRFEPCGLNQIYSLRYGTVPIVHRVGGLADSVVDAIDHTLRARTATGFVFDYPTVFDLNQAIRRALALYADRPAWRRLMRTGMDQDFSWTASARQYAALYRSLLQARSAARVD